MTDWWINFPCFCCCSVPRSCLTLYDPRNCSTSSFPVLHYLPECAQTHVHWVTDAIQPSYPLSPSSPLALNLSHHQDFFLWVSSSHQVARKYWNFSFSISLSNEYSGLIPFRIDWFDLLAIQGTLNSLFQHHNSKTSTFNAFCWTTFPPRSYVQKYIEVETSSMVK